MKKLSRLTALLLALMMLVTSMPLAALADTVTVDVNTWNNWVSDAQNAASEEANTTETVTTTTTVTGTTSVVDRPVVEAALTAHAGTETGATQSVSLPIAGKLVLSAYSGAGSYQWQVKVGNQWANIMGDTGAAITLTYAKIQNAMSGSTAQVRCVMTVNGESYVSATANVSVDENVTYTTVETESTLTVTSEQPVMRTYARTAQDVGIMLAAETPELDEYSIVINYVFENNEIAANAWTGSISTKQGSFDTVVANPVIQGYAPAETATILPNGVEGVTYTAEGGVVFAIDNISSDITVNVVYQPTNVNYTVIHYQQNVDNDNYTEYYKRETLQGLTHSAVPEVAVGADNTISKIDAKEFAGFYALLYEKPEIAADGSTVVEVYYDRNYYLMTFDLDGGYGVEPIYAKYGTDVSIKDPQKAGYTFAGWNTPIPATMPAENVTYTASWTAADSSFTVVYWLENADDDGYSVFGSNTIPARTGSTVNGAAYQAYDKYITTDKNFADVEPFIAYEKADQNVVVAGDKSTVVNVYFSRNEYTLRFYYAMEDTTNKKYYVIGGSTYAFGASGDNTNESIDNLTEYYMHGGSWETNRGEVDEIPGLNSIGSARGYSTGSTTDSKTVRSGNRWTTYNYRYYYISFSAKYGADISELWPCNVFNSVTRRYENSTSEWKGTEAFVSAWNGEHHVYYSQHKENQTIKGNYNQLDSQLLWDSAQFGAYADGDNTVDYLCFWENGADIGWSVPELYRYQVWVPVLEGQDTTGLTTKVKDGVTYYLRNTYDTVDNSDWNNQTPPAIKGLTYDEDKFDYEKLKNFDTTLYKEAWEVNFYYTRNSYNLSFQNAGQEEKAIKVDFEADISKEDFDPTYPTGILEDGGYEFEGWYTSSTCATGTKFEFDGAVMPANDLMLYANWIPKVYEIRFYQDESLIADDDPVDVYADAVHGKTLEESFGENTLPNVEENYKVGDYAGYDFVGWFYRDEDGKEVAFSVTDSLIKSDLNIYAKWSSNVLVDYTINYVYKDGNDVETVIADPTTGSALAGNTKTFDAKGGTDLYAGYQEGYFPVVKSHSLTIDIDDATKNEFTFYYVQKNAVPYTVYYVAETLKNGEDATKYETITRDGKTYYIVADTYTNAENRKAVVTEKFKAVSGYMPDAYQKRLVVDGADNAVNEIIFYYSVDTEHAYYKITHYTQNTDGKTWTEYASSQIVGEINKTYSADPLTIDGFTYDSSIEETVASGELTANGLELKLYYTRNRYPYEVRYLEQGTGKQLADPKKDGEGLYGAVVSESAIDIPNYTAVDPTSQTLTIKIEESQTEATLNIITFYYTENEVTINYEVVGPTDCGTVTPELETVKVVTGEAAGSTATANEPTYRFVGWYAEAECTTLLSTDAKYVPAKVDGLNVAATYYAKFEYNLTTLTIKKEGMESIDAGQSFLFKVTSKDGVDVTIAINGNGSETISGLTVGDVVTVKEIESWSWRYTAEADRTAEAKTIKLEPSGNTVTINNTRNNPYWLDGDCYAENVFGTITTGE